MEADEIGAEQPTQYLLTLRQGAKDLGARPWCVQEPANLEPGAPIAQHRGQQHEVIVVHPHKVRVAHVGGDDVGKLFVDALVRLPAL